VQSKELEQLLPIVDELKAAMQNEKLMKDEETVV
jgi:hypothetical protein